MEEIIQHVCRQKHTLLLKDDEIDGHKYIGCKICESAVEGRPYYVCDRCKYYVHKSCEELPKQINFPLHPRHPLSLTIRGSSRYPSIRCNCCGQFRKKSLMFSCDECDFWLDIECYEMSKSLTIGGEGQDCIQHSTHPHLLLLVHSSHDDINVRCFACQSEDSASEGDDDINVRCFACQSSDGGVYYGCYRCKYFLHKQCIHQLPQQIQTSHHPNHNHLSLLMKRYDCQCKACGCDDRPGLYFECPQCDFLLCLECGLTRPRINYEDHPHHLCFIENKDTTFDQCNVYGACLKLSAMSHCEEFKLTNSSIFGCLGCGFKLHFLCGPLPSLIKHESHLHNLYLVELLIEDDSGEYTCDICEQERNPRIRVYHCGECKFIAHVHCVLPQIVNVLKGDLRNVKLKTLRDDVWNSPQEIDYVTQATLSPLTLRDLIHKLPEDELRWLKYHFYWDDDEDSKREEEVSQKTTQLKLEGDQIDEVIRFSTFTKDEFMSFIFEEFYSTYNNKKLKIKSSDLALKVVDIEGYSIPLIFASAMKNLVHKYGDISTRYSQEFKSICFFFVCKVMKEMHTTLVIDITKDLLQQWYHYIRFLDYYTYLKVDFLKLSLEEITRKFYFQQLRKVVDEDIPTILDKKIAELQKKIAKLQKKKDNCSKFCESTSKEESIKEGLEEALKAKWKLASQIGFHTINTFVTDKLWRG